MIKVGKKYGMLTCVGKDVQRDNRYYIFKCDCGATKSIIAYNVERGATVSCGHYLKKMSSDGMIHRKHGCRGERLYTIWKSMRERCTNPKQNRYKCYGEKGVTICDEWNDYLAFRNWALSNGYRDDLSIDRIDVSGNYEPSNCRWSTIKEQANNKTNNRILTLDNESHTLAEWSDISGISTSCLWARLKRGWLPYDAVWKAVKRR